MTFQSKIAAAAAAERAEHESAQRSRLAQLHGLDQETRERMAGPEAERYSELATLLLRFASIAEACAAMLGQFGVASQALAAEGAQLKQQMANREEGSEHRSRSPPPGKGLAALGGTERHLSIRQATSSSFPTRCRCVPIRRGRLTYGAGERTRTPGPDLKRDSLCR